MVCEIGTVAKINEKKIAETFMSSQRQLVSSRFVAAEYTDTSQFLGADLDMVAQERLESRMIAFLFESDRSSQ